MKKIYLSIAIGLLTSLFLNAQQSFTNFQAASMVIGQPSFTTNLTTVDEFTGYNSSCSDISSKGMFAVASQFGRVLIYNNMPSVNGASANVVIGKTTFSSTTQSCTQNLCSQINGIIFSPDGQKLIASDYGNNRVLIWNTIPTVNGQNADVVIGQTSFTSSASGVDVDKLNGPAELAISPDGRLIISDMGNNRILVYNKIPTANGAPADVVIGQATFTTNTLGNAANKMNQPWGISLSPVGKLFVAEVGNNRVSIFNSIPTVNNASADNVIGQTVFGVSTSGTSQNKMSGPIGVACSPDGKVAVSEFFNHRVLIFNAIPSSNGVNADVVLGQPDFISSTQFNGGISSQSMNEPYGLNFDLNGRLFVNGRLMNRTMIFGSVPTQTAELAINISASSTSLCAGSEITYNISIQNNGSSAASNVIATTALPLLFNLTGSIVNAGVYSTGYWTIPSIPSGSMVSMILTGTVNTSVPETLSAYASIWNSQQFDSNMSNNGASSNVNISSATPPSTGTITGPPTICPGGSYPFAVNGVTNATSYIWSANNATVTGTGSVVTAVFGSTSANLFVLPSNNNCTGSNISLAVTVSPCTGIGENLAENMIARVYPNPTNGVITVESENSIENIQVMDLTGKVVMEEGGIGDTNYKLNLSSFNNSVYLLRVKLVSGEVANTRIIVQK